MPAVTATTTEVLGDAPIVFISPEAPTTYDDLTCHVDSEEAHLSYEFFWWRNGEPFMETTKKTHLGDTVPAAHLLRNAGSVWSP